MWNVSLSDMSYWQTCHDPECRMMGYRGEVHVLPEDVQRASRQIMLEKKFEVDDEFEAAIASLDIPGVTTSNFNESTTSETQDAEFEAALHEALESNPELYP